jgi:hypothetical protein
VLVTLVGRRLADVKAPIAVMGCFNDHVLFGQNFQFDQRIGGLVHTVLEQKLLGAELGAMSCLPLTRLSRALAEAAKAGVGPEGTGRHGVGVRYLLCVSLGEVAHFSLNDYRFVFMKALMAVKLLGCDSFAVALVNAARVSYRPERTLQAIFDGFADAFDRYGLVRDTVRGSGWFAPVRLFLAEPDFERFHRLEEALRHFESGGDPGLRIRVEAKSPPRARRQAEPPPPDLAEAEGQEPVLRFSISMESGRGAAEFQATAAGPADAGAPSTAAALLVPRSRRRVFRCSASTESAVIPVRLQEVDEYLVRRLQERMVGSGNLAEQERFGQLMASYFLPEDFVRQIDGQTPVTLAVDTTTAVYPWEMAAVPIDREIRFLGADVGLTRQFSMLAAQPGVVPPINNRLDLLLIADPAPRRDGLDLPKAREEGYALVRTLARARKVWGSRIDIRATIRIGSVDDWDPAGDDRLREALREVVDEVSADGKPLSPEDRARADAEIALAARCDPVEVLSLLLTRQFDVVHFAGHGVYDPDRDNMGWVFNRECVLSADEIFRVRQVPRLVFANACRSSQIRDGADPTPAYSAQNASLAEAFFLRGIENYLGAAWPVDDEAARQFAVAFYSLAMGIDPGSYPRPATLMEAVRGARAALLGPFRGPGARQDGGGSSALATWGAYQHYGKGTSRLIDENVTGESDLDDLRRDGG